MKGQLKASNPAEYLAQLEEPRKVEVTALNALVRKLAPKLEPCVHSGILGYGRYHYKYASGREGDSCRIGIASNKNYISLYISACDGDGYLAERYKEALPKANIGKGCVRFKRLGDLDQDARKRLIKEAAHVQAKG